MWEEGVDFFLEKESIRDIKSIEGFIHENDIWIFHEDAPHSDSAGFAA